MLSYTLEKKEYIKRGWTKVTVLDANVTTTTVTKLTEDTEYEFRVFAVNPRGPSEPLQTEKPIKTARSINPPSQPEPPVTVVEVTSTSLSFEWLPPKENGGAPLVEYRLNLIDTTDSTTKTRTCKPYDTTFETTEVKVEHEYILEVRAVNKVGEGPPTASAPVKIPPKTGTSPAQSSRYFSDCWNLISHE